MVELEELTSRGARQITVLTCLVAGMVHLFFACSPILSTPHKVGKVVFGAGYRTQEFCAPKMSIFLTSGKSCDVMVSNTIFANKLAL